MNDIQTKYNPTKDEISRRNDIVSLEETMKGMEENLGEDPFPLIHHFVEGCYAREILLPKDSTVVGKIHKHEHFIIFLSGDVTISSEHGTERINKPGIAISPMGVKRAVYAHEESRIITIHLTKETELEKIEREVIVEDFDELAPPEEVKPIQEDLT
jgi:quercetin dioxygenase-like cupin family protein